MFSAEIFTQSAERFKTVGPMRLNVNLKTHRSRNKWKSFLDKREMLKFGL